MSNSCQLVHLAEIVYQYLGPGPLLAAAAVRNTRQQTRRGPQAATKMDSQHDGVKNSLKPQSSRPQSAIDLASESFSREGFKNAGEAVGNGQVSSVLHSHENARIPFQVF